MRDAGIKLGLLAVGLNMLLAAPCAAGSAEQVSIPFELKGGHIFVQAFVDGKGPFLFGFDTGASGIGRADARLTSQLMLPKVSEEANSDGIKTVITDVVEVAELRLGAVARKQVRLLSRDYNGSKTKPPFLMGIIGRDFAAEHLLTIDYPRSTLSLTKGRLRAGKPGVVPYGPSFALPVCIRGRCYIGKVDTGSSMGLVLPKDIALAIASGPAKHIGTGRRTNSTSELYEVKLDGPITVAGVEVRDVDAVYADPSDGNINVGSRFLKDYVLTIDQHHRLLRISRGSSD